MIGTVLEDIPPRKITSFEQTFKNNFKYSNFNFWKWNGKFFISCLAFIAGGEYVLGILLHC
jgi:hypothetical protein